MVRRRLAAAHPITADIPGEGVVQNVGQPFSVDCGPVPAADQCEHTHSHTHTYTYAHTYLPLLPGHKNTSKPVVISSHLFIYHITDLKTMKKKKKKKSRL